MTDLSSKELGLGFAVPPPHLEDATAFAADQPGIDAFFYRARCAGCDSPLAVMPATDEDMPFAFVFDQAGVAVQHAMDAQLRCSVCSVDAWQSAGRSAGPASTATP